MDKKELFTKEQIAEWKEKWGKIYLTTVDGEPFVWRKLRRKEYVEIMQIKSDNAESIDGSVYDRQEEVVKLTVLYPENIAELIEMDGGLATSLSDEIMLKSGFKVDSTVEL